MTRTLVIHDTSVLLNLLATERFADIWRDLAWRPLVCPQVESEVVFLRTDDGGERRKIELAPWFDSGVLLRHPLLAPGEQARFVRFAEHVDEGEAAALAAACENGWALATDDRIARRLFLESANAESLWSTPRIMRQWAKSVNAKPASVSELLGRIERRARYRPTQLDPDHGWWRTLRA